MAHNQPLGTQTEPTNLITISHMILASQYLSVNSLLRYMVIENFSCKRFFSVSQFLFLSFVIYFHVTKFQLRNAIARFISLAENHQYESISQKKQVFSSFHSSIEEEKRRRDVSCEFFFAIILPFDKHERQHHCAY